ncbi:MAG: hypothetical protein SPH68_02260, partial [Candidatus Borkfalkiaceae bacterium]|nr:hypothetical protein [Clostridia bacterium]MDY6222969.1 hypothetical protein [Christensenellaceae bacterium]
MFKRRKFATAAALTVASISLMFAAACGGGQDDSQITISLDRSSITMIEGNTATITATATGTTEAIEWNSNNTSVVTVSDGVLTAIAEGSTTVVASVANESASCTVTVEPNTETLTLTMDKTTVAMLTEESVTLNANLSLKGEPINAEIFWEVNDGNIVELTESGKSASIKGLKAGTAKVVASAEYYGKTVKAESEITVTDKYKLELLSSDNVVLNLKKYENSGVVSQKIEAKFSDKDGVIPDAQITYVSSKTDVAAVAADGTVTPVSNGKAIVEVRCEYEHKEYKVNVFVTVQKLEVETGKTLYYGADSSDWLIDFSKFKLTAAEVESVYYNTEDAEDYVLTDGSGNIQLEGGKAKINPALIDPDGMTQADEVVLSTVDGAWLLIFNVTYITENNLEIRIPEYPLSVGGSKQVCLTVHGKEIDNSEVVWSSGNEEVVQINDEGVIYAVSSGFTDITGRIFGIARTVDVILYEEQNNIEIKSVALETATGTLTGGYCYYPDSFAGQWVSFSFSISEDYEDGGLLLYCGKWSETQDNPVVTQNYVFAGMHNVVSKGYDNDSFVLFDQNGKSIFDFTTELNGLSAGTYTVFAKRIVKNDYIYFTFTSDNDFNASNLENKGVTEFMNLRGPQISVAVDNGKIYKYEGPEKKITVVDKTYTFSYDEAGKVNVEELGYGTDVVDAYLAGDEKIPLFVTDESGKPVVEDGKLSLDADNIYVYQGTNGVKDFYIEFADRAVELKINIVQEDMKIASAKTLPDDDHISVLLLTQEQAQSDFAAGKQYMSFDFYMLEQAGTASDGNARRYFLNVCNKHVYIGANGFYIASNWQAGYDSVPGDYLTVYDKDGNIVNNNVTNVAGNRIGGSIDGALQEKTWYTIVINLNGRYAEDFTSGVSVSSRNAAKALVSDITAGKGDGKDYVITDFRYSVTKETPTIDVKSYIDVATVAYAYTVTDKRNVFISDNGIPVLTDGELTVDYSLEFVKNGTENYIPVEIADGNNVFLIYILINADSEPIEGATQYAIDTTAVDGLDDIKKWEENPDAYNAEGMSISLGTLTGESDLSGIESVTFK